MSCSAGYIAREGECSCLVCGKLNHSSFARHKFFIHIKIRYLKSVIHIQAFYGKFYLIAPIYRYGRGSEFPSFCGHSKFFHCWRSLSCFFLYHYCCSEFIHNNSIAVFHWRVSARKFVLAHFSSVYVEHSKKRWSYFWYVKIYGQIDVFALLDIDLAYNRAGYAAV